MKRFPNQIADVAKLTQALSTIANRSHYNLSLDDDPLGESFLRQGIIKPGNQGESVDAYLSRMRTTSPSNQSHRTVARDIKRLFRLSGLLSPDNIITHAGQRLVQSEVNGDLVSRNDNWKAAMRVIEVADSTGVSHPYQILLRLLSDRPGTPRALCPVVFAADDDSEQEYQRILALRDSGNEIAMRNSINVSAHNWNNAKKILPAVGLQIGDITEANGLHLTSSLQEGSSHSEHREPAEIATTEPRPRLVTAATIAQNIARDEPLGLPYTEEPTDSIVTSTLQSAIALRKTRTILHNDLVRTFANALPLDALIWEGVFDLACILPNKVILAEMKTLDGSVNDERSQVRSAVSQLLYYESFSLPSLITHEISAGRSLVKIAVFDNQPSPAHTQWVEALEIAVVWGTSHNLIHAPGSDALLEGIGASLLFQSPTC